MKNWLFSLLTVSTILFACNSESGPEKTGEINKKNPYLEYLQTKVKNNPDSIGLRMLLINSLDSVGRYSEAIAQVDSMIKRDSLNNGIWFTKAQLQESNGDTLGAIKSYEYALNIYPSVEAQLSLGNLLAEYRDKRALAVCNNVAKAGMGRETEAHCDFIAGVYYSRTGDTNKAFDFFDRTINNSYTYMEAYMEKGFIYFEQKKYKEALEIFEKAVTVNNLYADAYYWQAKTYEAMGNREQALLNFERAYGLDKTIKEAADAIKRLK